MNWLNINTNLLVLAGILSLPAPKSEASNMDLFQGCWHSFQSKRVMQWAAAYPESLSHVPSDFQHSRYLMRLKNALNKLATELEDFDDVYQASLTIAARSCPSKRQKIGQSLRRNYVVANKLYSELRYIHSLMSRVGKLQKNSRLLNELAIKAQQLKSQLTRGKGTI